MEKKQSEFNKVFSAWDILVIAFGAMIGWGWVVSSGGWIQKGGVLGAALGFVVGGVMIFFVGLTYAELTAAMPQCGGEHVWSHRAMGPTGSFVCTWAIVLGAGFAPVGKRKNFYSNPTENAVLMTISLI